MRLKNIGMDSKNAVSKHLLKTSLFTFKSVAKNGMS